VIRETLHPKNEEDWLEMRKADITSTMMPALFELSPYATVFELYHAKKSGLVLPFESNERMEKGKRMERYAAEEVALKEGWTVRPLNEYIRISGERIGSSFDFEATCPKRGKGILEIKALDFFIHKESWSQDEIPADKEIQIRHQLMCADRYEWGVVCAFTSVYDYHKYFFERDQEFEDGMVSATRQFWKDVDEGNEPKPDFYRDAPVIDALYRNAGGDLEDRTGDEELEAVLARYNRNKQLEKQAGEDKDAAKAEIHRRLAEAGGAWTDGFRVKAGWTRGSQGTTITQDMVGTIIGARAPYRQCLVTEVNKEK